MMINCSPIKGGNIVKTQNGFTLLENKKDVRDWLAKQIN